ncbi:MAG: 2-oxoglutarate dehydrogenase E1 component [Desulfuromonadales bacterium]
MSLISNISPQWIENLYRDWRRAPQQVPADWQAFFRGFELGEEKGGHIAPETGSKQSAVDSLIYRYRDLGHLLACTDPLSPCPVSHPLLALAAFGLEEADLDRTFHPLRFLRPSATLREIVETLRETYCRSIGAEFMHIQDPAEREWLKERMERRRNRPEYSRETKLQILRKLLEATAFEQFLHRRFIGQKRFSLEGGEVLIPLLEEVVQQAAASGVRTIVLGMPHRGRLNVLANIFERPLANLFAEFEDNLEFGFVGEGDVKYHKGFSIDRTFADGGRIHLSMASNPSHLEAVDPVVEGKTRARQDALGAGGSGRVLPVLLHGDAAFAGQGMVAETLNLSQLEGYATGGTLHIVLNNQIGFTTVPENARSTRYATDVAKMLSVPIFHVHGEDPEAVLWAGLLALEYRQKFGRDVVVEVICYRRQGHNEGDEPYFTQPLMYEAIKERPPLPQIYAERLRAEGIDGGEIDTLAQGARRRLEAAVDAPVQPTDIAGYRGKWSGIEREWRPLAVETGVDAKQLGQLIDTLTSVPEGFAPHPKISKQLDRRREAVRAGEGIDWATGESLAFASLVAEGTSVRFSGQDSRRGTFSQRHAVLFDVRTGGTFCPLQAATAEGAAFSIYDSLLSEAAVLGFEYGYSLEMPRGLTLWEAQFGDFVNGAQVIIDQFIVSSHTKWDRASGVTLLLPHGFEGQGPEHSSARIERFLQLCADDNMQVAYPSTPAQYFHLLRRQVKQPFRRPLVVFTPKALLRHPLCTARLEEFTGAFREIIPPAEEAGESKILLLCSGKIYFDLLEKKQREQRADVALLRIEQFYPLRTDLLREALAPYRKAAKVAWVQEEPRNAGAWGFLSWQLAELLGREAQYIGRPAAASPAVGSHRLHKKEQDAILAQAFAQEFARGI